MRGPGASGDKGRLSGMNEKYPHRFICLRVQSPVSGDVLGVVALFGGGVVASGHSA